LTGKKVIVGVVDYGFDFTLDDFCSGGKTRALALWDQQLSPTGTEASAAGYGYGVEYMAGDIDAALATSTPHTTVRHTPPGSAHGTHVLGIAAGNGSGGPPPNAHIGVAYEADIIFVNPAHGALSLSSSDRIAEAIKYIFDQAKALKKAAVVNVSLGHNGAGHDGESFVERVIDRLLESARALVKSAGNEGAWQTHASGRIATAQTFDLMWVAGGGLRTSASPHYLDRTPNTLEVWYSSRDRFRVRVSHPSIANAVTGDVNPGQQLQTVLSGHPVYIESERFHPLTGRARILVRVGVDPATGFIASGTWRVNLVGLEAIDEEFDAWIDVRDPRSNLADQSYFLNPNPEKTISPPGTVRRGVGSGTMITARRRRRSRRHRAEGRPPTADRSPSFGSRGDDIVFQRWRRGERPGSDRHDGDERERAPRHRRRGAALPAQQDTGRRPDSCNPDRLGPPARGGAGVAVRSPVGLWRRRCRGGRSPNSLISRPQAQMRGLQRRK
jgi:hypothetical protein